jgi:hypothetical protein
MTNRRRVLWPLLLLVLLVLTALTFAATRGLRTSKTAETNNSARPSPPKIQRGPYVRRSSLSSKLNWHLTALGDRLEKPGKERLSVTATLQRSNDSQPEEVVAVLEYPEQLRLTMKKGNQNRVLKFEGKKPAGNPLNSLDQDLIETLVYGSAEHFFTTQMEGMATRLLGSRFRIDDGSTADYNGPYYDVYKVEDQIKTGNDQRSQLKLFYFNSETLLLERVIYEINRDGAPVKVEERLGDWTRQQGQQVARRIERLENGESVFVLTVRTTDIGPRADDGTFSN